MTSSDTDAISARSADPHPVRYVNSVHRDPRLTARIARPRPAAPVNGVKVGAELDLWGTIAYILCETSAWRGPHLGAQCYGPAQSRSVVAVRRRRRRAPRPLLVTSARPAPAPSLVVDPKGSIRLDVMGNGHGHGLSQYGARGAAIAGLSYDRIVGFYYPGTS